ncbi:hypothetical protein X946_5340 [Burkholderia sp. ABCPW 111]|nr:hypothetical protein X946_5340 [Burkholderia sp. ABCPW 111]
MADAPAWCAGRRSVALVGFARGLRRSVGSTAIIAAKRAALQGTHRARQPAARMSMAVRTERDMDSAAMNARFDVEAPADSPTFGGQRI